MEPTPSAASGSAATPTGTPPAPTSPSAAAIATAATAAPTATIATASNKPLTVCNECTTHCYTEPTGECPNALGPELDQKLGCRLVKLDGRQRNGAQCCYGYACPGRPLLLDEGPTLAPLVRGAWALDAALG